MNENSNNQDNIKVSICIVTYNHDNFIKECLDSLLNQITTFAFEIIIGNDASTDNTKKILSEYEEKFTNIIVINHENNVGAKHNLASVYSRARGEYIAHLDGDDLALQHKLQRQVQILDSNKDCMICSHAVELIDSKSKKINKTTGENIEGVKDFNYLIDHLPFFAHSSKMFRNISHMREKTFFEDIEFDFELHLKHARYGNIYHIPEILGCYRVFTGVATGSKRINQKMVQAKSTIYDNLIQQTTNKHINEHYKKLQAKAYHQFAKGSFIVGHLLDFRKYIKNSVNIKLYSISQISFYIISKLPIQTINLLRTLIIRNTNHP